MEGVCEGVSVRVEGESVDVRFIVHVHVHDAGCTSVPICPSPPAIPLSQSDSQATLEDLQKPGMDAEPNQVQLQ